MKNLFYILAILILVGCKTETLKITIEGEYSGEAHLYNTETQKIDTIESSGNRFSINLEDIQKPTLYYLTFKNINDLNRPIYLILSNQETQIKFNELITVNENPQNIKDAYPNKPLFLTDPNKNEEFYRFQDLWIKFFDNVTKPELDIEARKGLYDDFISNSENVIKENNSELVSACIIDFLMNDNLIQLDKIQLYYSYLESDIQTSFIGKKIKREVGFDNNTVAPKFMLQDFHGNNYSLDSLIGKKVLLHFWSSTCAPCVKEIPELLKLANENKDLIIINISLDTDKSRWISGMERLGIINMINFCDFNGASGDICKDYHIKSIPANYLIDSKGSILLKTETIEGLKNGI
jgi:thiol-disulfide isomerase/thioredoxin